MSELGLAIPVRITSGAMYFTVPTSAPVPDSVVSPVASLLRPKSHRYTCSRPPAVPRSALDGLMSRWTSPAACAASRASAS